MDYSVDLCQLSHAFYQAYPQKQYPEIMIKDARPYTCLLIETHEDYLICIPFRSSIQHNNAFLFANTKRSTNSRSGLDYKKTILIKDSSYIENSNSIVVDNDEYTIMMSKIDSIVSDIHSYISTYVNHMNGTTILHPREYLRRYRFSTLPYFHDILGLQN